MEKIDKLDRQILEIISQNARIPFKAYCFFNIISPLMSIFIATIGYKIFRTKR